MSEWDHRTQHLQSVPVHRGTRRELRPRQLLIAVGIALAITAIAAATIWTEKPRAESAADAAPVESTVAPVASKPGTPVPPPTPTPRPVEVSPPLALAIAGDGSWLVGKQIKRGTYRTAGQSTSCYWALRSNLSYSYDATIVASYGRRGAQTVALGPNARAFVTYGCGRWELVR